jgi:hypothetical protein
MVGCGFFGFPAPERASGDDEGSGAGGAPPEGGSSGASGTQGGTAGNSASGGIAGEGVQGGRGGSTSGAAGADDGGTAGTRGGTAGAATGGASGEGGSAGTGPTLPVMQGLTLWLDAASLTDEDGPLTTWPNRATSGESDATQPVEAERPELTTIGTRRGVSFDGTRFMVFESGFSNFNAGLSFFTVTRFVPRVGCDELLQFSTGLEMNDISFQADIDELDAPGVFLFEVFNESTSTSAGLLGGADPQLISVVATPPDDAKIFLNDIVAGGETNTGFLPVNVSRTRNFLGSGLYASCDPFRGVVFELLLYNRALTPEDRALVSAYLQEKWNCCDG